MKTTLKCSSMFILAASCISVANNEIQSNTQPKLVAYDYEITQDFVFTTTGEVFTLATYTPKWGRTFTFDRGVEFAASLGLATGVRFEGPPTTGLAGRATIEFDIGVASIYAGAALYGFWGGNTNFSARVGLVAGFKIYSF